MKYLTIKAKARCVAPTLTLVTKLENNKARVTWSNTVDYAPTSLVNIELSKDNGVSWINIGSVLLNLGTTDITSPHLDSITMNPALFRLVANTSVCTNLISYVVSKGWVTPPEASCKKFIFSYGGSQPEHIGIVNYIDCGNIQRQLSLTWEESNGNYYETEICAIRIIDHSDFATDVTDYTNQLPCA